MPIRLLADALQTAAATLPRATEVNAIEDCTVEGKTHRNKIPRYNSGVTSHVKTGLRKIPSNGKTAKVNSNTVRCRRQCVTPAMTAARDNFAPCIKNSKPIMPVVSILKPTASCPEQGKKLAASTTASNSKVMLSGKKRGLVIETENADTPAASYTPARICKNIR